MSANRIRGRSCLLVTNIFPPAMGGSSQVYAALAAFAHGDIAVLASSHDHQTGLERPGWRELDHQASYPVHRLRCIRPFLRSRYPRAAILYRFHEIAVALKLAAAIMLLAWRYRVHAICIADDETVGWLVRLSKNFLRRCTLIYCHGDDLQCGESLVSRRSYWLCRADKVVAANRYSRTLLTTLFGVPQQHVVLVQNGVDLNYFYPQPPANAFVTQHGLAGRRVLLTVARLVPRKGIDKVLEALPAVARRFPGVIYMIVGDGPQREALQTLSQRLGIADSVRFTGAVDHDQTRAFYNASDIVVLANREEKGEADGLPLVFLEANACGKPVIGGKAGGTAEVVRDGENGILVDGLDVGEIECAICGLLSDEGRRNIMGQQGLRMAQEWGWETRTRTFLESCRS